MLMTKTILLLLVLVTAFNAFKINSVQAFRRSELKDVPWPFTICGDGKWDIESVSLNNAPAKNVKSEITAVLLLLLTLGLLMMIPLLL